ncbi:hypothetical protein AVEN_59882-1 [Araneus ventricosus]|uniref:Uncharacterized protein n=1 Tax=Araneus ventricosus TaxID=182803 RepID=A0A4Y2GV39_ARAVE|nr:hypothetical protein AVEN_59882-1 [Araneus ventricosus]
MRGSFCGIPRLRVRRKKVMANNSQHSSESNLKRRVTDTVEFGNCERALVRIAFVLAFAHSCKHIKPEFLKSFLLYPGRDSDIAIEDVLPHSPSYRVL